MAKVKAPSNQSKLLTTGEVARYCDVSTNAVKKWIRNGRLKAFRTPGGHFRVDSEDFKEFLVRHQMPVYPEFFEKGARKVLLVDDDSTVREMLAEVIRSMDLGLEVEQAEDGYEALLKAGHSKPDLLVLDLKMPRMDGFEACRRIRSNPATSGTKILAISGFMDSTAQEEIVRCGASDYMRKPLNIEEFRSKVAHLLDFASIHD
ncbi:MAG TPA: response regulator [Candidatus Saccharimonadales bacterium]|nr:response regulator [Candidatus Saccharimonadales bacterium]